MTPDEAIADLNQALVEDGQPIRLQRLVNVGGSQMPTEVTCQAFVRGYQPQELVGGITQQDVKVIFSPTEIIAASWQSGRPANEDTRVPMKGNRVFINGRARNVEAAAGLYMAGDLVRIEMQCRG